MATGGTIQYGIKFNVDNSSLNQLKQELKSLQDITIDQYQQKNPNASRNTQIALQELKQLKTDAASVEKALQKAFNVNLGATNVTQFKKEIATIGLDKIYQQMSKLGPKGISTFNSLTSVVLTNNKALKQSSELLDKIADSFGNTVRWGITSSIWNNITGSIQKAWQYSKNLDSSLNDIRVVTGQSADQMERLAKNANKTAQALGNTTLDYTKAALIYYQQGLSDSEVQARTDVTLKLANVLNSSAEDISSYMTAIWNNFDNGSQSLEHYADVITALGAATAASSEEIATGLQKFASVADTVGLSYEYATTALATVVAQTRQSADTVGTAFKTLFARIQDLELGNTLDDGTTLGQYAEALQKVGINIKNSNGELKNMDTILNEMGAKWNTLNKAQQVALAQNVAGTRQYTQLVALMDNWDKFEINLTTAANSAGTLQRQQDIYMESTEAHLNKLSASVERLMDTFIDNKNINQLIDSFSLLINGVSSFIESIGGGGNALRLLGSIGMQVFDTQIARGLALINSKFITLKGEIANTKTQLELFNQVGGLNNIAGSTENILNFLQQFEPYLKLMNDEQNQRVQELTQEISKVEELKQAWIDTRQAAFAYAQKLRESRNDQSGFNPKNPAEKKVLTENDYDSTNIMADMRFANKTAETADRIVTKIKEIIADSSKVAINLDNKDQLQIKIEEFTKRYKELLKLLKDLEKFGGETFDPKRFSALKKSIEDLNNSRRDIFNKRNNTGQYERSQGEIKRQTSAESAAIAISNEARKNVNEFANYANKIEHEYEKTLEDQEKNIKNEAANILNFLKQLDITTIFVNAAAGIGQMSAGLRSLVNISAIWRDDSLPVWEKTAQTFTALGTGLMIMKNGWDILQKSMDKVTKTLKAMAFQKVTEGMTAAEVAASGLKASNLSLGESFKILTGYELSALGPLLAIVAAVAALGAVIYIYNKWYDKEARLQRQLEETKKQTEAITKAYNELNDTLSNYKSAREGLSALTEGTVEFYNQVIKANEEANKLIKSLNLLYGQDYTIDRNGLITFNEDALENRMFKKQQDVYAAQSRNDEAQIKRTTTDINNLVEDFSKKLNDRVFEIYEQRAIEEGQEGYIKNGAVGFTENDAEQILKGATYLSLASSRNAERARLNQFASDTEAYNYTKSQNPNEKYLYVDENSKKIVIQDLYNDALPQYRKLLAQQEAELSRFGNDIIRGYGNREDIEYFNKLSNSARDAIALNIGQIYGGFDKDKYSSDALKHFYNWSDVLTGGRDTVVGSDQYRTSVEQEIKTYQNILDQIGQRTSDRTIQSHATEAIYSLMNNNKNYDYNTLSDEDWQAVKDQMKAMNIDLDANTITLFDPSTTENAQELNSELNALANNFKEIANARELAKQSEDWDAQVAARNLKEYNDEIKAQAELLGTTTSALKLYDAALQNANKGQVDYNISSAEAAAVSYKFNKAYNEGRSTFEKNEDAFNTYIEALEKGEEVTYDVADGAGAIIDSLDKLGIILKTEDLKDPEILKNVKTLFSGTKEEAEKAFKALEEKGWVNGLKENFNLVGSAADSVINKIRNFSTAIEDAKKKGEKPITVTTLGDLGFSEEQLSKISGTADEVKAKLNSIGLDISDEELAKFADITKNDVSNSTVTTHTIKLGSEVDPNSPLSGLDGLIYTDTAEVKNTVYTLGPKAKVNFNTNSKNFGASASSGSKSKSKSTSKTKGEADRYHEVNTQIAKVNAELSKLEKQSQKTLGGDLLKNLNKQWQDLNKQAQNYNEKLRIARDEQEEVRKKLQNLGLGVKFNADGTIANYVEMYNKALKQLNAAEDKYDKKQSEANRKKVDKLKTQFEDLQKYMDRNDELISSFIPDIYAQAQEAMDKQVETNLKEFRAGIALAIDIKDLRVNWNDFKAKFIEDLQDSDVLGNVALDRANTAEVQKLIGDRTKQLNAAVSELSRNAAHLQNLTGDDLVKAIEEAKTNYEDLMKDYQELVELRNHAEELYKQALEDEKQAIQDQLDLYEKINDQLEKDKKLVELTYGDKAYDKLVKYSKLQDANNKEILKADVEAEKTAKRRYEEAQQMYQDGKLQAEDLKNAETDLLEASARVTDDLNNSLEHLQDTLKTTADAIAKAYSQDVSDAAGGLDFAQEEWDLINKHADQYLDTINRLTGENQLESKYLESIEKATSPAIQKKLKDAMDSEMKSLREKDKLSQYDLDRANKKYQVTLAQIALEEAQDNKSQMRLRRDSQGNYRYQYVADETQVNAAEEGLRTALADLYNFDKDRLKTTYNDILAIEKEYNQKRAEILADPNLSPEERLEKERLLHEQYEGPDGLITNAYALGADARANVMDSAFEDLAYLQEKNKEDFINMTDAEQDAIMTGLIPAWDSLAAKMAEVGANVDAQQQYWQDAKDALVDYQNAMAEDLNITDKDTEDIANATDSDLDFIEGLIKPMSEVLTEQNNIVEGARNWYIEISNIKDGLTPVVKALQNAKDTIDAIDSKKLQEIGIATGYNRTDATLDEFMNGGSQGGGNNNANVANLPSNPGQAHPYGLISDFEGTISSKSSAKAIKAVQYALQQLGYDIGASGVDGKLGAKTKAAITAFQKANGGSDNGGKVGPKTKEWFRLKGFDTGGYTGTWDDNNGRLAFLHQKELVLNSEDTKNILAATRTIRQAIVAKQDSLISAGVTPMGNDILEQNVHIEATFPNATSANEIEEALRNLVNAAAQRRRKI